MHKIITSLAVAEYNKKLNAVELNFKGSGLPPLYHETIDIAMNISLVYQTQQWLFIKNHFQDISPDAFLGFIKKWSERAYQLYREHHNTNTFKVAFYTGADSIFQLLSEKELKKYKRSLVPGMTFEIFSDLLEAKLFLSQGKEPKVYI